MYIKKVSVKGFKSLADFELELSPFTCLIGLNGCGKSTVLQFFDFISHVLAGDVDKWYEAREWEPGEEATSSGTRAVEFRLEFSNGASWAGSYEFDSKVCLPETIQTGTSKIQIDESDGTIQGVRHGDSESRILGIPLDQLSYSGSITSILKDDGLPPDIAELKSFTRGLRTFDTLTPQYLRRRDRSARDSIGHSGEHLVSYFDSMPEADRTDVINTLLDSFPQFGQLQNIFTQDLPGGWKELVIHEAYDARPHQLTRSRHINDGFLRLVAILSELRSQHTFLLFDEIENGINAEMVAALIDQIVAARPQVLVTTHSPMILNYLEDDLARESVVFLYKGHDGLTQAKRFFEIPSISEKLDVMGPGEAFVDTDLVALTEELNAAAMGA